MVNVLQRIITLNEIKTLRIDCTTRVFIRQKCDKELFRLFVVIREKKYRFTWYTPEPRMVGTHWPSIKKCAQNELVKHMSLAASAQRILFDVINLFQPSEPETIMNSVEVGKQMFSQGSSPQIPGSSKHESWLETVMSGMCAGRSMALSNETRLYTFVLLKNSTQEKRNNNSR